LYITARRVLVHCLRDKGFVHHAVSFKISQFADQVERSKSKKPLEGKMPRNGIIVYPCVD
jgi:hypothetical protein